MVNSTSTISPTNARSRCIHQNPVIRCWDCDEGKINTNSKSICSRYLENHVAFHTQEKPITMCTLLYPSRASHTYENINVPSSCVNDSCLRLWARSIFVSSSPMFP